MQVSPFSFVIPDADEVAGCGEGVPGEVEPAIAGEELIGEGVLAKKLHKSQELRGIARTDVCSLPCQVLRVCHTPYPLVHLFAPEARIDNDGTYQLSGWLQQQVTDMMGEYRSTSKDLRDRLMSQRPSPLLAVASKRRGMLIGTGAINYSPPSATQICFSLSFLIAMCFCSCFPSGCDKV